MAQGGLSRLAVARLESARRARRASRRRGAYTAPSERLSSAPKMTFRGIVVLS
jgi:hypothetical protein